jgi:P-type Ca2+ transporter type 2C
VDTLQAGRESHEGLTTAEARARLAVDGANALPTSERRTLRAIVFGVLREPMFVLLCAASGIYVVLGDLREALVLAASVVVILGITALQERRTERALEALRDLSSPRALVVRDGVLQRIAGADVVTGDLVVLSEGDRVPADAVLQSANDLGVDESLLTGESLPVDKACGAEHEHARIYSGTLVVKGRGRAVVTATGVRTRLGAISALLGTEVTEKTTLERETARMVRIFGAGAIALSIAVAVLYYALRGDWIAGVLSGVTLAMAIVPEEFPVVLTIYLALGAWRISRHGVLTRRMAAIEMLGAATVLCVDKTGTLTENRMKVTSGYAGAWLEVPRDNSEALSRLLEIAALACEPDPFDPMERAILEAARDTAPAAAHLRSEWRLDKDYPLTPSFLAVCHAWRSPSGVARIALKGAPETVLALCGLEEAERDRVLAEASRVATRGVRLLGVAEAQWNAGPFADEPTAYHYEWRGLVALADPLRRSVPAALDECKSAGIRVAMITGDYPATALAIAREAGLSIARGVISGAELDSMDEGERARVAREVNVFARIAPEQKLKLVNALKRSGEIVAMTGDGVNDAPALKAAHIGIAMGRRGTDVAREAAALVLTDDDFGAIVATIRRGRRIYQNIRNAMRYLISVHIPIAGMSFLPVAFGWPLLILPLHVVFLEFVIDPACSIGFEAEDGGDDVMKQAPRDPASPLFDRALFASSVAGGSALLGAVLLAYWWALESGYAERIARSIGFAAIVIGNLAMIFAVAPGQRAFIGAAHGRGVLRWIAAGALIALTIVMYVPAVADVFRVAPLAPPQLAVAIGAGLAGVLLIEVMRRRAPRR